MKIYTRGGDQGETGLLGGVRVSKHDLAIQACGDLDETCATIGVALACGLSPAAAAALQQVQQDLFVIGSHVAAVQGTARPLPRLAATRIAELEGMIDATEGQLEPMTAFILPGGAAGGASLHLARTVCRRAERTLVGLMQSHPDSALLPVDLVYLNRLSDLLFVMARNENRMAGDNEVRWLPGAVAVDGEKVEG